MHHPITPQQKLFLTGIFLKTRDICVWILKQKIEVFGQISEARVFRSTCWEKIIPRKIINLWFTCIFILWNLFFHALTSFSWKKILHIDITLLIKMYSFLWVVIIHISFVFYDHIFFISMYFIIIPDQFI